MCVVENRQDFKSTCLKEIPYRMDLIDAEKLTRIAFPMKKWLWTISFNDQESLTEGIKR